MYYGIETFNLNKKDFHKLNVFINNLLIKIIVINRHVPVLIYHTDAKIELSQLSILKRKWKLREKFLNLNHLTNNLEFINYKYNIDWNELNFI